MELFQQVFEEEGITLSSEDYYDRYLGFDDRGVFQAVFERYGRPCTPVDLTRFIARKSAYYQARIQRDGFPIFPGAAELLRAAAASEMRLGVVSGALRSEVDGALDQIGVLESFKIIVTAEDVRESKPDPESYRRGFELLNALPPLPERLLHPHEVLAIEDSPAGIESAAANGLATLGVAQTYEPSQLQDADQIVPSLATIDLAEIHRLFP